MRFATSIVLIAFGVGCSQARDVRIDPGELSFDAAFLVEARGPSVVQISQPFGLDPATPFGVPNLEVDEDNDVFFVGVDLEALRPIVPNQSVDRLEDLRLRAELPPATPDIYVSPVAVGVSEDALFRVSLDGRGALVPTTPDEAPALVRLALDVPADPAFCRERFGSMENFGATAKLLDPRPAFLPDLEPNRDTLVTELVPLASDRLLFMTARVLAIVDEGGTVAAPAPLGMPTSTLNGYELRMVFRGIAVNADRDRLVVVGTSSTGVILDYALDDDRLELVASTTVAADGAALPRLLSVAVADDGTVLMGAENGVWVTRAPGDAPTVRGVLGTEIADPDDRDLVEVVPTPDEPAPFMFGARGDTVINLDPASGDAETIVLRQPEEISLGTIATLQDLAVSEDGELQMAVGRSSLLQQRTRSGEWATFPAFEVPDLMPCSLGLELEQVSIRYMSAAIGEASIFITVHACAGVIAFARNDGCIAVLPLPGEVVHLTPQTNLSQHLRTGYGRLFVGGDEGRLTVLD